MNSQKNTQFVHTRIKYVFVDIVRFSQIENSKGQINAIQHLNDIVENVLKHDITNPGLAPWLRQDMIRIGIKKTGIRECFILLPTGDGVCICILSNKPNIHIEIATSIIKRLHEFREPEFDVRIGINENDDRIYKGLNEQPNVVGGGINHCQRVMDCGERNSILLSEMAYNVLDLDEKSNFIGRSVMTKHKNTINVYQCVIPNIKGLNISIPHELQIRAQNNLKKLSNEIHDSFHSPSLVKLMAVNFRLEHERTVLEKINVPANSHIPLPIRNPNAYKRYVFGNILGMLKLLPGYTYSTFSNLDFWLLENIGQSVSVTDFIQTNIEASDKGVKIRRLIMIPEEIFDLSNQNMQYSKQIDSLKLLYQELIRQGQNINTILASKKEYKNLKISDKLIKINDMKLLNLFIIRDQKVDDCLRSLIKHQVPNAYISHGKEGQMIVELLTDDTDNELTTINLNFSKNVEKFKNHKTTFDKVIKIAIENNDELIRLLKTINIP